MSSNLWEELLNDVGAGAAPKPVQQPTVSATISNPSIVTTPAIQQLQNQIVNTIQQQPATPIIAELLTPLNEDTPQQFEDSEEEEYDDSDIAAQLGVIDPPSTANFSLALPGISAPAKPTTLDLGLSVIVPVPQQPSLIKRGPGRPPKINTAQELMNDISGKDLSKSNTNNQSQVSQTQSQATDIAVVIPKKTLIDIGLSLQRIGAAIVEIGNK